MPDREKLDPSLEATGEERDAAERLRRDLEDGRAHDDADVLRALAHAYAPKDLASGEHTRLVGAALRGRAARRPGRSARNASLGVAAALALAAGVAFFAARTLSPSAPPTELARVRSTQPLFHRPFRAADGSARVDRIAMSRASDLRDNRFARWGVR